MLQRQISSGALDGNGNSAVRLRLYVAGRDAWSVEARRLCELVVERCHPQPCRLEVVDVFDQPQLAEQDRVLATPMLIRLDPPPLVRLIGGLWNAEFVMEALQLEALQLEAIELDGTELDGAGEHPS